jgi:glycosyltransferase involved in cell wall biosynthesis
MIYKNHTISLVIPCFNEEEGIKKILPKVPSLIDEIIVIDNNSTDETAEVAKNLGAKVIFEVKQGYGWAIRAGITASRGSIVAVIDGDGSHSAEEIPALVDCLIDNDLTIVWGNRFNPASRGPMPFLNWLGNCILSLVFSLLVRHRISDSQSGMIVFQRNFLNRFWPESIGMTFSEEIKMAAVLTQGFKWKEVGINYLPRLGQSKLRMWRAGFANLFFLFYKRFKYVFPKS